MTATNKTLHAIREAWPSSYIIWRTAGQTRTELETGDPGAAHKDWSYRMHVTQINAAARHMAAFHNIPLIDVEYIGIGMTPIQSNYDMHHPRDFLAMVCT